MGNLPCITFLAGLCTGFILTFLVYQNQLLSVEPIIGTNQKAVENRVSINASVNEHILRVNRSSLQSPRILCMILTMPDNHKSKALAVKRTWAPRCESYYFVSSTNDSGLHAVAAVMKEERNSLWDKTKFGIRFALEQYGKSFDYLLKADDDTFVIVENLRSLLKKFNPKEPMIMGRRFKMFVKQGYPSGGGGYVISISGLEKLVEGMRRGKACGADVHTWAEDVEIGKCAEETGVRMVDTLDEIGLERFHPFPIDGMINIDPNDTNNWLSKYNFHELRNGTHCCSNQSVSFHYVNPEGMYTYDFLIYHVRHEHHDRE